MSRLEQIPANQPSILRETADYIVIFKPSHWHSVKGKSPEPTIEGWLQNQFNWSRSLPEGGLVHRLDFQTSGCMLVAKNAKTFKDLQHRFRKGTNIKKVYWALTQQVKGARPPLEFALYFTSRYKSSKKVTVKDTGPKKNLGECQFNLLMKARDRYLFEIHLIGPGQRHQIRAGLSHLGFPIIGDSTYGGAEREEFFGLHSFRLQMGTQKIQALPPANWRLEVPLEKLHL